jgi:DNA-binding transcriptional ArsR family regulator
MPITRRPVRSATEMKALAHPLRLELLELLRIHGPLTATQAAALTRQSPANVSWHLRRLGSEGFARQASRGVGRQRPWKIVASATSFADHTGDAFDSAANDLALERAFQVLRRGLDAHHGEESDAASFQYEQIWLSADEAAGLSEQLRRVVADFVELAERPRQAGSGRRLTAVTSWVVPMAEGSAPD